MRELQKSTAAIEASLQNVRFVTFTLQKEENPKAGVDVRDEERLHVVYVLLPTWL